MLIDPALLKRADVTTPGDPEPADMIELARRIRPYAGQDAAIVVAPRLHSGGDDLAKRPARLRANGVIVPVHLALDAIPYVLTLIALVAGWEWGLAAVAGYCLQPYLIFAGTAMRPRGLHTAALLRPVHDPYVWARTLAGRWRSAAQQQRDAELGQLSVLLRSPDLVMHKPATFTLERCGSCGHVFQNPRLTPEGLNFYYRDAYDGLGAAVAETVFLTATECYQARARLPEPFAAPKAWLDVGTGRYDVVSMHHYLEHTRDPLAELDAAAEVLPVGGYLLIELPDPQWRLARLFGRYWMPWFQPQHQHMMPIDNLTRALAQRGLRPVATERGPAHQANDAVIAAYLFFSNLAPDRSTPWSLRPPTPMTRAWRCLVWAAAGLLLDQTLGRALAGRWDRGNAYRVLARREDSEDEN